MRFSEIKPFVRFIRVQKQFPYTESMCALDNRIFYCTNGEGKLEIDGDEVEISSGSLLYWRSALPYRYTFCTETLSFIACNFDFSCVSEEKNYPIPPLKEKEFDTTMLLDDANVVDEEAFGRYFVIDNAQRFEEKFIKLREEYNNKQQYYSMNCTATLTGILVAAVREYNMPKCIRENDISERVISYIRENYQKKITYADIAAKFHYHPNHISRIMLSCTGMSLHKFLTSYRIGEAVTFLQSGKYSVREVAELVGIPDISQFSKCFKKYTSNPPSKYRYS